MPLVRKNKMNTKLIKLIAAAGCTATALGLSFTAKPNAADPIKHAKPAVTGSKEILISNPADPAD
jgi:hypothetical protein